MNRIKRRVSSCLVSLVCALIALNPAAAADRTNSLPLQILLIRHAEKPDSDDSTELSPQGQRRAAALADLFRASPTRPDPFSPPDFIFATRNSKHSHRPVLTVTPLARSLNLPISDGFADEEVDRVAREILRDPKYSGKTVLISWHHGMLPDLARALGATNAPDHWKKSTFDRVWQLRYDQNGTVMFRDRPQRLLPGDSNL